MKKKSKVYHEFYEPLFCVVIYVYPNTTAEEVKKLSTNSDEFHNENTVASVLTLEDGNYVLAFFNSSNHKDHGDDINTILLHECFHLSYKILSTAGIELSDETEEVYAYYQQYIFKQIKKLIKGKTK